MDYKQQLRELQGNMSQQEFASKIGITQSTLSKYLTGRLTPSREAIAGLCRAFPEKRDVILDVFFSRKQSHLA